ncbi:Met-10+ like-protein-domain-containing protein [Dipodascopsis tothii]|uniref:Met-10+ like-protein-domain-containing protein n=1 Tax=Dipodascopsis tothii TaxID=44089 RepID=UPI0034CE07EC
MSRQIAQVLRARQLSMADYEALFRPPVNRGMRVLDREFFRRSVPLAAARFADPRLIPTFSKQCQADILQLQGVPHVAATTVAGEAAKVVRLAPHVRADDPSTLAESTRALLAAEPSITLEPHTLELKYGHWRADEILAAVLPEELLDEVPSGFTMTGHVAHMNLRDEYRPYGRLIGELVLDKNPKIRTVVNKTDSIDTKFRTFAMEVLAGDDDTMVEHHESGCRFRFDFARVYWNSRLHTEHDRLIQTFRPGEAVCDVFAGVGPFAVPAGRRGIVVLANDLNGPSYAALCDNIKLNKVAPYVHAFNLDGRDFIRASVAALRALARDPITVPVRAPKRLKPSQPPPAPVTVAVPSTPSRYVMNLPDTAIEFLDAFRGLLADDPGAALPRVHVYCFHKSDPAAPKPTEPEVRVALRDRVAAALGHEIDAAALDLHFVRQVAPTKGMWCVSFDLPAAVAHAA